MSLKFLAFCFQVRLTLENPKIWAMVYLGNLRDDFQLTDERSRSTEDLCSDADGALKAHLTAVGITP